VHDSGEANGIDRRVVLGLGAAVGASAWSVTRVQAAVGSAKIEAGDVAEITKDWPEPAKAAAADMLRKYGPPQEATARLLVWRDNGPWKRTIVHRDGADHAFATPHKDVLEQVVEYKVPLNFFNALAVYNGSVLADRTRGELTAHCDKESTNFLALNLAHDIIRGRLTAEQAREAHTKALQELMAGKNPDYTQKLMIGSPQGELADPDTATIAGTSTNPR
jgi:hypothetical protein